MKGSKLLTTMLLTGIVTSLILCGCGNSKDAEESKSTQGGQETVAAEEETKPAVTGNITSGEASPEPAAIGASDETAPVPDLFEANPAYDKYATVDYMVEDIGAEFTATVSAKEDGSEYEVHCNLEGAEQIVVLDKDYNIVSDKTGNMSYDAPLVVKKAVEENKWEMISR